MIKAEHLYKSFALNRTERKELGLNTSKIVALQDLSFEFTSGQCLTILGTKNSGKSTLLKILGGILPADSGKVYILASDPKTQLIEIRRQSAYFTAGQPYFEYLSIQEQLSYYGRLKGVKQSILNENIAEQTNRWNLSAAKKISALSSEERLRLGIAQALIHNPGLLLLDEPDLGLDLFSSQPVHDLINYAKLQGISVVYATNNLSKILMPEGQIMILHKGKNVYNADVKVFNSLGSPADVFMKLISDTNLM
jgi:ABC-type multidrug transport system ATPase subunit